MIRILFVCHGNICRSPMAEFILKDMVEKRGTAHEYFISSAATSTEEIYNGIGNPVYPPAQRELALHGISCGGKRAVQLRKSDYDKYDCIIGMDSANIRNMHIILGGDRDKKILKLKELTDGGDVADPWYSGDFAKTYEDIYKGCEALLKMIEK